MVEYRHLSRSSCLRYDSQKHGDSLFVISRYIIITFALSHIHVRPYGLLCWITFPADLKIGSCKTKTGSETHWQEMSMKGHTFNAEKSFTLLNLPNFFTKKCKITRNYPIRKKIMVCDNMFHHFNVIILNFADLKIFRWCNLIRRIKSVAYT